MDKNITYVSPDILKVHPYNERYLESISGISYEKMKSDISKYGFSSKISVAPDMTIIYGHMIYKAAKDLNIKLVPIDILDELIDEDIKLQTILAASEARYENIMDEYQKFMKDTAKILARFDDAIKKLQEELLLLKMSEEISTEECNEITYCAKKRVLKLIGDDPLNVQKYFTIFIQNLYKDLRRDAGLGYTIQHTKKQNYDKCIDYIQYWYPKEGCYALRHRADQNAQARREAKELGYL